MTGPRILFVQHALATGGSVVSLREVVTDALQRGYQCTVVCPNPIVAKFYDDIGAATFVTHLTVFNHNTVFFYRATPLDVFRFLKMLIMTFVSFLGLIRIVRSFKPEIIHLNSSNLILYTFFFRIFGIPTIYHVRENVVKGYFGIRKAFIRTMANALPKFIIYISEYELELLRTRIGKSFVIYNYVHEKDFLRSEALPAETTAQISPGKFKVIVLGGLFKIKGGDRILQALQYVGEGMELLVLGCSDPRQNGEELAAVDGKPYCMEIVDLLGRASIRNKVKFFGRVARPSDYIAYADALLFWAASPHFPRPVFEAWLLRKPVVYFNPQFKNKIIDEENVCVVGENSAPALASALAGLQASRHMEEEQKAKVYHLAKANFTEANFNKIDALYRRCLKTLLS